MATVGTIFDCEFGVRLWDSSHPSDLMLASCPLDSEVGRSCADLLNAARLMGKHASDAGVGDAVLRDYVLGIMRVYMSA
jgi:hypothetical protein